MDFKREILNSSIYVDKRREDVIIDINDKNSEEEKCEHQNICEERKEKVEIDPQNSKKSLPVSFSDKLSGPLDQIRSGFDLQQMLPLSFQSSEEQKEMKETYFCQICFSYDDVENSYRLKSCGHRFCKECLTEWFTSKITANQLDIYCFKEIKNKNKTIDSELTQKQKQFDSCGVLIKEEDILVCISNTIAEKYQRYKINRLNPNTSPCSKCDTFNQQINPFEGNSKMIICEKCGHSYCSIHGDQHLNTTCLEFEKMHYRENLINTTLIAKITKPCPKCKIPIQKRSGCNHMKCPQCETSFCWLCTQEIEDSAFPEHFQKRNAKSGCKGKQFDQQEEIDLPCCSCVRVSRIILTIAILLGAIFLPFLTIFAVFTTLLFTPCFFIWARTPTFSTYKQFLGNILNISWVVLSYFFACLFALILLPVLCFLYYWRDRNFLNQYLRQNYQDEDDQKAIQDEAAAIQEVDEKLNENKKVIDLL